MISYKVKTSTGYCRVYSTLQGAKRDYGSWCKKWHDINNKQRPNWVRLYWLENYEADWIIIEEIRHEFND